MKKLGVITAGLIVLVGSFWFITVNKHAQNSTLALNLQPGFQSIQQANIQQDISYLASKKLEGRESLTTGDKLAIDWIVKQFKQAGLSPANGQSYLQPVPVVQYIPDPKNSITVEKNGKQTVFKKPDVYMEFPKSISLISNIVFAGYGVTAPDLKYDDYQSINVKDKIVLVFEHEPEELNDASRFNGKANTIYATNRTKALIAQQHGAVAIIIAPEPNRTHPSNQERRARLVSLSKRKSPIPSQAIINDELHIPVIVISDKIANKIMGDKKTLSTLQTAIDKDLTPQSMLIPNTTLLINNQNKSHKNTVTYNVVGLLEGGDPKLKNETILVTAHHDHDGKTGKSIWYGADDNASGTAGAVSLARAFTKNANSPAGMKPKRSLLFAIFASEERGLLGSFYMANHPLRPLETTRAMINFDMIGRNETFSKQTEGLIEIPKDTNNRINIIGSHFSPDYQKTIAQQNKLIGLTLDDRFNNEYALNSIFRSDQFPFLLHEVPAIEFFTGFHPDYHQKTDTADKINYEKMVKILQLAYLTGYQLANETETPAFVKNPKGQS